MAKPRRTLRQILAPGIRLKLTLFTLFFVTALLAFSFAFSYFTQSRELSESFRKEIELPVQFVSDHVGELYRFAEGFVQLESFALKLGKKTEELKKFRKVVQVKESSVGNKWRSFIKTFGANVKYSYLARLADTYYSTYLTKANQVELEGQLKAALAAALGHPIDPRVLAGLRKTAAAVAAAELPLKEGTASTEAWDGLERKIRKGRSELLESLRGLFLPLFSARLERIQFAAEQIRILSYDTELKQHQEPTRLFDTDPAGQKTKQKSEKIFAEKKFGHFRAAYFEAQKKMAPAIDQAEFTVQGTKFEVRTSPVYVNPAVVGRVRVITAADPGSALLKAFKEADLRHATEIKKIADKKSERFETLREKGIPPYRDPEFMAMQREYRSLVVKRDGQLAGILDYARAEVRYFEDLRQRMKQQKELSQTALQEKRILEKRKDREKDAEERLQRLSQVSEDAEREVIRLKAQEGDIGRSADLKLFEALLHLREAALLAGIKLNLFAEGDPHRESLRDSRFRRDEALRYQLVRKFIYDGNQETKIAVPPGIKSPLMGGVLRMTRSEAEDYMHEIDTTPVFGETGLLARFLAENTVAYNLVTIDKSFGNARILKSIYRLVGFAAIIALVAIFAAWYFSGLAVHRIASLSATSQQVREGNLQVAFDGKGYDELASLGQSLNSMVEGLKEREELKGELMAAEEIQKRLLPSAVPRNLAGRADIAGFYKAMVGVGGDYFDYIAIGSDQVAIAMGDVSNHGVGPALVMAITRSQLHAQLREKEFSLKGILLKLNEQLYAETPENIFVTFFLGLYNLKTGDLQYISAGHSKPLYFRAGTGKTEYLDAGGMPLGMDGNDFFATTLELRKVNLGRGDIFLQYTDGLSEAMNTAREQFGYERMESVLKASAPQPAIVVLNQLAKAVEGFSGIRLDQPGPSALSDDIALVCLKRT